ncbi:response regulator [Halobacteria archaeon AArc-dxtr1]|nr:response regulator [Halobacteria archaeon AArc-dxtr1]
MSSDRGGYRILLVEDDELQARLYRTMLDQGGAQANAPADGRAVVETAGTLEEARESIESAKKDTGFDLILLDLNLPDSRKLATLDAILEAVEEAAVVALTEIDDDEIGRRTVERGAQDYLVKDHVTPRLLRQTVTYAVERRSRTVQAERQRRELAMLHWLTRHEIRDDAAVVLGWASELSPSDPNEARTVSRIVDAGEHIVELTESVGAIVQAIEKPAAALTSVDMEAVVAEESRRIERRYEDVRVAFDASSEETAVQADRFLNVVVRNVLTNVASEDRDENDVEVTVRRVGAGEAVELEVSVGQVNSNATSSGLSRRGESEVAKRDVGLFLVRTFVERYGGRLEIEDGSGSEGGRTVRVTILAAE